MIFVLNRLKYSVLALAVLGLTLNPLTTSTSWAHHDKVNGDESCVIGAAGIGYVARAVWVKNGEEIKTELIRLGDRRCGPRDATLMIKAQGQDVARDALAITAIGAVTVGALAACIVSAGTGCPEAVAGEADAVAAATADLTAAQSASEAATAANTLSGLTSVKAAEKVTSLSASGIEYINKHYGDNWFYTRVPAAQFVCLRGSVFHPTVRHHSKSNCKH
jgi:hypothetical protein